MSQYFAARAHALRTLGLEKVAYGWGDFLGDAVAAGTAAGSGVSSVGRRNAASKSPTIARYYTDKPPRLDELENMAPGTDPHYEEFGRHNQIGMGLGAAHAIGGAVGSVGDHAVATPLLSMLGQYGGRALLRKYAPTAGAGAHAAVSSLGALAGRTSLRGFDALMGGSDK